LIHTLADKIAVGIKSKVPEHPASVAVLRYSVSFILNTVFIILLTLVISFFTGRLLEAFIALVGFALLRQVSGGYHLTSGTLCIVVSTAGIILLSFAQFDTIITYYVNGASALLILIFAPSRIERQTKIPARLFPLLKWISLGMIAISTIIANPVLTAAFFAQALTLIRTRR